ncbi:alpha-(1,3)-fucosyltransferase C-like [Ruditapes philippinarum]|uniref:alpha-(1,3)-fucosyltransferase C-like n=1 Tax=Ruditapes philippinarum TaxID=129788 RepID=UPI00295AA8C1|nr:alpha-(1,3)-fucosyltransferase C-like [Ruditapes philippinarum]
MNAKSVDMSLCEYKQCTINFIDNAQQRKDFFSTADAVLFQGGRLINKPPIRCHANQVYVFTSIESPIHLMFSYGGKRWYNTINWTMTYRLDSDILYKYGSLKLKNLTDIPKEKNYEQIFKEKTKEVAWLVSDCPTEGKREKYVNILQKYMKVDIYGRCGPFKNCTKEEGTKCLQKIGKDYKFYLSFENSVCKDYMTEKVFGWFQRDIITVVRGARNYDKLLPKNTYIDTHKFTSVKDLAEYLKKLSKNKEEYIKYLREKDKYETESLRTQVQRAYCDLCKRLHHIEDYKRTYQNIDQWWLTDSCQRTPTDIH